MNRAAEGCREQLIAWQSPAICEALYSIYQEPRQLNGRSLQVFASLIDFRRPCSVCIVKFCQACFVYKTVLLAPLKYIVPKIARATRFEGQQCLYPL